MKQDYDQIILQEVYLGKRRNLLQRLYLRAPGLGKNANYMLRKVQRLSEGSASKLGYLRWRRYRSRFEKRYGCFVGPRVRIGKGLVLPHPNGIVFGQGLVMGENCTVYQQVTFGRKQIAESKQSDMPVIGDRCIFCAGSKVLGNIHVADGTVVAANAVLLTDTVPNGVYAGVPATLKKICENKVAAEE